MLNDINDNCNKKRIAFIAHGLSNGGAERVASIISNYLANHGYFVLFVAAYNDKREYSLDEKIEYVFINTQKKNKYLKMIDRNKKIYQTLKKYNINSAISFLRNEIIYSLKKGIKIIYSIRNDPNFEFRSFLNAKLGNYVCKKSAYLVFQTPGARDFFDEKIVFDKSSIIINPLEVEKLPIWSGNESKEFITACRLNKQKNLPMLINAFHNLHKIHDDYVLKIYGSGEESDNLKKLIKELNAKEYILMLGHTKKIHEIMEKSFCFVLTSDYEGLSNSMLEALAIGMPCICTDCPPGGAKLFINDNENGFLIPVKDSNYLKEKLIYIINNRNILVDISKNAQKIRDVTNLETVCSKWMEIIDKI